MKPRVKLLSNKHILCFVLFEDQAGFIINFIPSERLKSWFPQGGRLRQSEILDTINNIFTFIIDLLRRKGKSPGTRNE